MRRHGKDLWLIGGFLAAGLILLLILLLTQGQGARVEVRVSGMVVATYALDKDGSYRIEGKDGGTNLLVIRDGTASVTEADCPDKLCVGMGKIRYSGQSIICLPHEVVISITGGEAPVDEITG